MKIKTTSIINNLIEEDGLDSYSGSKALLAGFLKEQKRENTVNQLSRFLKYTIDLPFQAL